MSERIQLGWAVIRKDTKQSIRTGGTYTGRTSKIYQKIGTARAQATLRKECEVVPVFAEISDD